MKKLVLLLFVFISVLSAYSQNNLQDGDQCFDNGDYVCAKAKYNEVLKQTTGKDKQIAEIRLKRTEWCVDHLKVANQAFSNRDYKTAKENYQDVIVTNPKDTFVKAQFDKCTDRQKSVVVVPVLRKATSSDLEDIWNNKYGVMPKCRQNLIDAGIDPVGAQSRINKGEGKPSAEVVQESMLSVSNHDLSFPSFGGKSEPIKVYLNKGSYSISLLPPWCSIQTFSEHFIVSCSVNNGELSRSDWFKVKAGDKDIRINVSQSASKHTFVNQYTNYSIAKRNCFNCPKAKYTLGVTAGYIQPSGNYLEGFRLGLKVEPLFKYGFGLNTGLNFEGYSTDLLSVLNGEEKFEEYSLNIPLHLEYRLNFSRWFNIFAYGGPGVNILTNKLFEDYYFPVSLEYGGGLRINHIQFNVGKSLYIGNLEDINNLGSYSEPYQDLVFSVSYMF